MKFTKEQKTFLKSQRQKIAELLEEQSTIYHDTIDFFNIDDDTKNSYWIWDYLFDSMNSIKELEKALGEPYITSHPAPKGVECEEDCDCDK